MPLFGQQSVPGWHGRIPAADANSTYDSHVAFPDRTMEKNPDDLAQRNINKFKSVVRAVSFTLLQHYALRLYKTRRLCSTGPGSELQHLDCSVDQEPMYGYHNICYTITFSDGFRMVARLPANSIRFQSLDVEKMDSTYHAMRYARNELGVPAPEVYAWETTSGHIGCPFALVEFIKGVSVAERWHDGSWITEERRLSILENYAITVVKLQTPRFTALGRPVFNEDSSFSHVGPGLCMHSEDDDVKDEDEEEVDYAEHSGVYTIKQQGPHDTLPVQQLEGWPDVGSIANQYYCEYEGCAEISRLALLTIPESLCRTDRITLAIGEDMAGNIMVDDECNITGILGWGNICTDGSGLSATRFPEWIIVDWLPRRHNWPGMAYDEETDQARDSPRQLASYRRYFLQCLKALMPADAGYDPRETTMSAIVQSIVDYDYDPLDEPSQNIKLLSHAFHGRAPFTYLDCADAMEHPESRKGRQMTKKLRKAFEKMWSECSIDGNEGVSDIMTLRDMYDAMGKSLRLLQVEKWRRVFKRLAVTSGGS